MTIRKRLLILLSLTLTIFLLIVWYGVRPVYENALLDERKVVITQYLESKSEQLDNHFDDWIRVLFEFELAVSTDPRGIERQFQNLSGIYPDLLKIRLIDAGTGEFMEVLQQSVHPHPVPKTWKNKLVPVPSSSNLRIGWDTEFELIILSKAIQTQSGRELTITAFFDDATVRNMIAETKLGNSDSYSALWMNKETFVSGVQTEDDLAFFNRFDEESIQLPSVPAIYSNTVSGAEMEASSRALVATTPLSSVPYWLNLSVEEHTVTQPIDRLFKNTLFVLAGGFLFLFISSGILSRYINRPVQKLVEQIIPMKSYDFSKAIDKPGLPELRPAAETIEQVRRQLQRYQQANVEQMLLQESRLNLLMDNSSEMLALFDEEESVTLVNKRMRELLDDSGFEKELTWENLKQHSAVNILSTTHDNRWSEKMMIELEDHEWEWNIPIVKDEEYESSEKPVQSPVKKQRDQYHTYTFNVKYLKALADGYNLKGAMLILYDLTQQREMDRKRDEMIYFIMHELKNPLSGVSGIIELLQDETIDEETSELYFNLIDDNVNKLFSLTNRFLDVIKLESNGILIEKEVLDLKKELSILKDSFHTQLQEKNISLDIQVASGAEYINASKKHFQDLLANLLSNGIKYGPKSRTILVEAQTNEQNGVLLAFTDHGYGIAEDEIGHIFEKFYRIKRTETESGTGLGLAYVKSMIEAHGGTVEAESNKEIGTKFTLTFPQD